MRRASVTAVAVHFVFLTLEGWALLLRNASAIRSFHQIAGADAPGAVALASRLTRAEWTVEDVSAGLHALLSRAGGELLADRALLLGWTVFRFDASPVLVFYQSFFTRTLFYTLLGADCGTAVTVCAGGWTSRPTLGVHFSVATLRCPTLFHTNTVTILISVEALFAFAPVALTISGTRTVWS